MATPLTDSINALTTYANEVTGASDTTLSDAVHTLASGYGQGGNIKTDGGTLYIDADTNDIVINHNLGGIPDFAYICADVDDGELIPYDSCVMCSYGLLIPPNLQNIADNLKMKYMYQYRHPTSGNILSGASQIYRSTYSNTTFDFVRGVSSWKKSDANGNPIPYIWIVGRFTD